jgi:filamentous hemagglutinin family protein
VTTRLGSIALALLLVGSPAEAEVVRDGSIGPPLPIGPGGMPDGTVPGGVDRFGQAATYLISSDLGEQAGGNLFHSFGEFDLDTSAEVATFEGPSDVVNVISRVTGPARSNIFGTIRSTIDGADVFLLNPHGVFFAQSAQLDVRGSFHVSSAERLRFADGSEFDTTAPTTGMALTWETPTHFGFLGEPASITCCSIVIQATESLTVPAGETLSVVGSNQRDAPLAFSGVRVTGDVNRIATIRAPGAKVQLASAAGATDIPLDLATLDPDTASLGRMFVAADAHIDVGGLADGDAAGTIVIRGGKFAIGGGSSLTAVHRGPNAAPTAIDVAVSDEIEVSGAFTSIFSSTRSTGAAGRGGDVSLAGDVVTVAGGGLVQSASEGAARGGDVSVVARNVNLDGGGQVSTVSLASGRGGDVAIAAEIVDIAGGASLVSQTTGDAPGGTLGVTADSLTVVGGGAIESLAQGTQTATGGAIAIDAVNADVANFGSRISSLTESPATGGELRIGSDAVPADAITVSDAGQIISRSNGAGTGGRVDVAAASLAVTDEGRVQTVAQANGAGGDLSIRANSVVVSNATNRAQSTLIASLTLGNGPDGCCRGGDLTIDADSIEVVDGGQIQSVTEGSGDAGALSIADAQLVGVRGRNDLGDGSAILTRVKEGATGDGGFLSVDTRVLEVEDGAFVTSDTRDVGDAGGLAIGLAGDPAERVSIRGGPRGLAQVSAASIGGSVDLDVGQAGDLVIRTATLELRDGGQVSSSTSSAGNAGNVTIAADRVTIAGVDPSNPANESGVFAQSNTDRVEVGALAGVVEISADDLTVSDGGTISVSTDGLADAGAIVIDTQGLVRLARGGTVRAETRVLSSGGGGSIDIRAGNVEVSDGASISARTNGAGRGGSVAIAVTDTVRLENGGRISGESTGSGDAGDITVLARGRFESERASVTTSSLDSSGGRIEIRAGDRVALQDARIETNVRQGAGGGGDVTIASEFVVRNRDEIRASAIEGPGGNIDITAGLYLASAGSVTDASSELGIDGEVRINGPQADLTSQLATLPKAFLDASALLRDVCAARTARAGSFTVQRRAPLQPPPDASLSPAPTGPWEGGADPLECPMEEETP